MRSLVRYRNFWCAKRTKFAENETTTKYFFDFWPHLAHSVRNNATGELDSAHVILIDDASTNNATWIYRKLIVRNVAKPLKWFSLILKSGFHVFFCPLLSAGQWCGPPGLECKPSECKPRSYEMNACEKWHRKHEILDWTDKTVTSWMKLNT